MSESAYNSPLLSRKLPDSCFSSPARSIASLGEPHSLTDSEFDTESETLDLITEVPLNPDQTVVDGWVKFRDNKRVSVVIISYFYAVIEGSSLEMNRKCFKLQMDEFSFTTLVLQGNDSEKT